MRCCMTVSWMSKSLSQMKEVGIYKDNMTRRSRCFIRGFFTSAHPQSMSVILFGLEIYC